MFKVSTFSFNACTKTCARLSDCFINNVLIHFVPNCQDTCTQFVNVLDPLVVDLLLHYRPHFVVDWFTQHYLRLNRGCQVLATNVAKQQIYSTFHTGSRNYESPCRSWEPPYKLFFQAAVHQQDIRHSYFILIGMNKFGMTYQKT